MAEDETTQQNEQTAAAGTAGGDPTGGGGAGGAPPPPPTGGSDGGQEPPSIDDVPVRADAAKATATPVERETAREAIRSDLARGLLWLLTITIGAVIVFVGLGQVSSDTLTQSIFPSLVTLTGTALGFYFGAQQANK